MEQGNRKALFTVLGLILMLFLTGIHTILTPFVLAALMALLISPSVRFVQTRTGVSRGVAVGGVYMLFVILLAAGAAAVAVRFGQESDDLAREAMRLKSSLPVSTGWGSWAYPYVSDVLQALETGSLFSSRRILPYVPGALTGASSVFVFLISLLYFLKDGDLILESVISWTAGLTGIPAARIRTRTASSLKQYLRGEIVLVALMSAVSFVILTVYGVRFSLLLALFTGVAEIIPLIGPVAATTVTTLVALLDGRAVFSLPSAGEAALIVGTYFILRQLEDLLVIPVVMGKATRLHPLLILLIVLVGAHVWGVIGMILAVPVAAMVKSLTES